MSIKNKNIYLTLIPVSVIFLVLAFVLVNLEKKSTESLQESQKSETVSTSQSNTGTQAQTELSVNDIQNQNLVLSESRCRGCGRCAVIDPEHFIMQGSVAKVISQENLQSPSLQEALNECPVSAINLT